jgi:hypothetical protein
MPCRGAPDYTANTLQSSATAPTPAAFANRIVVGVAAD